MVIFRLVVGSGAAVDPEEYEEDDDGVSLETIPVVICIVGWSSATASGGTWRAPVGGGGGGRLPEKWESKTCFTEVRLDPILDSFDLYVGSVCFFAARDP